MVDFCIRACHHYSPEEQSNHAEPFTMSTILVFRLSRFRVCLRPYRSPHVSPRVYPPGQKF